MAAGIELAIDAVERCEDPKGVFRTADRAGILDCSREVMDDLMAGAR